MRPNQYLINKRTQVGIAIITYTDRAGDPHILLSRSEPRWPGKDNANHLQFCGGKIDKTDTLLQHTAQLSLGLRQQFLDDALANTAADLKNPHTQKRYVQHLETLLEGTIREAQEETRLNLTSLLQDGSDQFIQYKLHEPYGHNLWGGTDLHYIHIHLGQLSKEKENEILNTIKEPKGDILSSGVAHHSLFKNNFGDIHVEGLKDLMHFKEKWELPTPEHRAKLSPADQAKLAQVHHSCSHDPSAHLERTNVHHDTQYFPGKGRYDNGRLAYQILEDLKGNKSQIKTPNPRVLATDALLCSTCCSHADGYLRS